MIWLKQSTAATIKLGPFVDDTDGKTAETALTISQADVRLSKNGGDMAQKNDATAATHDELGYYDVPLNATDTGTLGRLRVMVTEPGALAVWDEFIVVPANAYDSLVLGTDYLAADAMQVEGADATDSINAACDTAISDAALATATALALHDTKLDGVAASIAGQAVGDTLINHLTRIDANGNIVASPLGTALGIATAGSRLALYLAADTGFTTPVRLTTAATDGTWALHAAAGTYTLVVTKDGHYDAAEGDSAITRTVIVP